ncbi:hypothetical protein SK128_001350, partial [Halocaridina rubra]
YRLLQATDTSKSTNIEITELGKHRLEVMTSQEFKPDFVLGKVEEWSTEVRKLTEIAKTEACSAHTSF